VALRVFLAFEWMDGLRRQSDARLAQDDGRDGIDRKEYFQIIVSRGVETAFHGVCLTAND
jgi:hypothetical protein